MYLKTVRSCLQKEERTDCFCVLAVDVICERSFWDNRSFWKVGSSGRMDVSERAAEQAASLLPKVFSCLNERAARERIRYGGTRAAVVRASKGRSIVGCEENCAEGKGYERRTRSWCNVPRERPGAANGRRFGER